MEIWKPIPNLDGYYASSLGMIKRNDRVLKPNFCGRYLRLIVVVGGKRTSLAIHRLVMTAFYGKDSLDVDHIDGNKLNNRIENLEYVSKNENMHRFYSKPNSIKTKNLPVGVEKQKNRYRARIYSKGIAINLGSFKTIEDAESAYMSAKNKIENKWPANV